MAAHNRPTIILVSGSCHVDEHYGKLKTSLEALSYPVSVLQLSSTGAKKPTSSQDDAAALHTSLLEILHTNTEAILVLHSFAGVAGTAATKGLGIEERKTEGKKGGIRKILYIASYLQLQPGRSMMSATGAQRLPWHGNDPAYLILASRETLYNDIPEGEGNYWLSKQLPQSSLAGETAVDYLPTMCPIPCTYLVTTNDKAIPPDAQRAMAEAARKTAVERDVAWRVEEVASGHFPFLGAGLGRVVEVIVGMAA